MNACQTALLNHPDDINLLCLLARASISLRLFEEAQGYLNEATRLDPKSSIARETYGDLLLVQGKSKEAIKEYDFAKRLNPQHKKIDTKIEHAKKIHRDLQKELHIKGVGTIAATNNQEGQHLTKQTTPFEDEINEAIEHRKSGRSENAEDMIRAILKKDPNHVEAARMLAEIAYENEKYSDAEIFLLRVVKNAPSYARAWLDLIKAQRELKKFDEALQSANKLLKLGPDVAESYMVKASVEGESGMHDEAIKTYKRALKMAPNKAGAMHSMAHHLKTLGRQDEAIDAYRQAISVKPDYTEAYWSMANLKTFKFEDKEIQAMEDLLNNPDLPDAGRVHLFNALGLEYESRKDFDKAFEKMSSCNAIRRKAETYDPVEFETMIDNIIEIITAELLTQNPAEAADVTPIFIVGLPRSGSTLIEQILASHSLVEGTHELHEMSMAMQSTRDKANLKKRFPEALEFFKDEHWALLGKTYLESTVKYRTDRPCFIDKNPNNFTFIGPIKLAIPNAKIINARRHPLDSCYGSFKQLFASGQPFSYDLMELGEYYMEYSRIMDYWHEVCPGFVLDVHYEEVVSDLDVQVKRILEFCDLPFEEGCLRFYETKRAVKTASSEQVRKPIYSSSVNLWRNYEDKLADLIEILEPLLSQLPKKDQPKFQ
ncbi:MAG: sulfotransferase [Pseudomonadota bacterium]|nr:sulfotransferase [Pseudomonadota bacterium]